MARPAGPSARPSAAPSAAPPDPATGRAAPAATAPLPAPGRDRPALVALFVERLHELGSDAWVVATTAVAQSELELLVAEHGWQAIACEPGLCWPGIAAQWTAEPRDAALGLCLADAAIAETGSVVVYSGPEVRRGYSLVPPAAGFFVPASVLVPSLGDVLRALPADTAALPSCVSFISGPSGTSDIAATHVTGVHGPGEVFVWVIADE
jgi:L-lactate utilization protein LutC